MLWENGATTEHWVLLRVSEAVMLNYSSFDRDIHNETGFHHAGNMFAGNIRSAFAFLRRNTELFHPEVCTLVSHLTSVTCAPHAS